MTRGMTNDGVGRRYQVPAALGPNGTTFVNVANSFVSLATMAYPDNPQVADAARQSFQTDGGITHAPQLCSPAAPPPPPAPAPAPAPTPVPTPPPAQVAVPDVRGDSPGAARSELSAVGLALGTQTSVVDDTCNDIGSVLSQTPSAGTLVSAGTAVNVSIGRMPPHPCP